MVKTILNMILISNKSRNYVSIIKLLVAYLLLVLDFIPLFFLEEVGRAFGMEDREDELRVRFLEALLE